MTIAAFSMAIPEIVLIAFVLAGLGFWLWMLIDCASNETDQTQKIVWILLIVLIGIIGAPAYFFVRKLPRKKSTTPEV